MTSYADGIASAGLQLLGSLLGADSAANAVNLALAIVPANHRARGNALRGRITRLIGPKYASLSGADRQALEDSATEALGRLKIDDELVRGTNDARTFQSLVWVRSGARKLPAAMDPVTAPYFEQVISIISDWVADEVRSSPELLPLRVDRAISDIQGIGDRIEQQNQALKGFAAALEASRQDAPLDRQPGGGSVGAADFRPEPVAFIGRGAELAFLGELIKSAGCAMIAGRAMTGRYELAREWWRRAPQVEDSSVIVYQDPLQFHAALLSLAGRYGSTVTGDSTRMLRELRRNRPSNAIILVGVDRVDLLRRLVTDPASDLAPLIIVIESSTVAPTEAVVRLEPLSADESLLLLQSECGQSNSAAELELLANRLVGEPLLIRQAAAVIRYAPGSVENLLQDMVRQPLTAVDVPLVESDAGRTAGNLWRTALDRFDAMTGLDGLQLLGLLHVMSGHAAYAQFWLTRTAAEVGSGEFDKLSSDFERAIAGLARLGLIDVTGSWVSARPMLLAYVWSRLGKKKKRAAANACLMMARATADRVRVSHHLGYYAGIAWLQDPHSDVFRALSPKLYDDTVIQLSNVLMELDLREHAHALLWRLLDAQVEDSEANPWPAAIRFARVLDAVVPVDASLAYVAWLVDEYEVSGPPSRDDEVEYWALVADVRWRSSQIEDSVRAATRGLRVLDEAAEAATSHDSGDHIARAGLLRVRGWAHIAQGAVEDGLTDLEAGYRLIRADENLALWEQEYRSHTQLFLWRNGVDAWHGWRDRDPPPRREDSGEQPPVGLNTGRGAVLAAQESGDFELAMSLLAREYNDGLGYHYDVLASAQRASHRSDADFSRIEGPLGLVAPTFSAERKREIIREVSAIEDYVQSALDEIERLPEELRALKRIRGVRNALWIQLANAQSRMGDLESAIDLAKIAAASDKEIYGPDDTEYANDIALVGQLMWIARHIVGLERVGDPYPWLRDARDIYARPGPTFDHVRLAGVEDYLRDMR